MKKIISLHGFLGRPSDWDFIPEVDAFDLFAETPEAFEKWAENFCLAVTGKPILVGYSMGGRLAMHALIKRPDLFSAAVLISAHTGLPQDERVERLEKDQKLASRFLAEPWDELMHFWNGQPVLNGHSVPRFEKDYHRERLSEALNIWSLGRQDDLREKLAEVNIPIHFVVGEKDQKFVQVARNLKFTCSSSRVHVVEGAGHRLPLEKPAALETLLSQLSKSHGNPQSCTLQLRR